jgi:hypothetical protein
MYEPPRFSLSRHTGAGALLASLLGALWVLHYLFTTQYGVTTAYVGTISYSLGEYVLGSAHNLGEFGSEALFIVFTRFLLAFAFSWPPLTMLIALVRR